MNYSRNHHHAHHHQRVDEDEKYSHSLRKTTTTSIRTTRGRGMTGLMICVVICVLSLIRESFNMADADVDGDVIQYAQLEEERSSSSSSSILVSSAKNSTTTTTTTTTTDDENNNEMNNNNIKTTRMMTMHHPRVVILSGPFSSSSTLMYTTTTSTIANNMINLLDENYLSSMKDSSAMMNVRRWHSAKSNKRMVISGLAAHSFTAGAINTAGRSSRYRSMVLAETGTNTNSKEEEEKEETNNVRPRYWNFERYWFQKCIPVTEENDDNRSNNNSKTKTKKSNNDEELLVEEVLDTTNYFIRRIRTTCNTFHEVDIITEDYDNTQILSMEGSWRSVWKFKKSFNGIEGGNTTKKKDEIEKNPSVVLKLLHTHHEFNSESFSIHQMDAMVMEVLTASSYVVDSYGFCGQSVLTAEAMSSGRTFIKDPKHKWLDRLRIARDLARGLADLHAFSPQHYNDDGSSSSLSSSTIIPLSSSKASLRNNKGIRKQQQQKENQKNPLIFAHHDINFANVIVIDPGKIQWNDFNLGIIARYDRNKINSTSYGINKGFQHRHLCPVPIRYASPLWRSPEEILNQTGYLTLRDGNTPQAADVYSLGNVLFQVLTRHQPWTHLETKNETKLVTKGVTKSDKEYSLSIISNAKMDGKLPNLPDRYVSRDEAKILWQAVQNCYERNPKDRPSALNVAEFLGNAYDIYNKKYVQKYNEI